MKRQRINPKQIIIGMMNMVCPECKGSQWVWFRTTEEHDAWTCPHCREKLTDEDNIQTQGTDTDRNGESKEEVSVLTEDSEEKQGFERPSTEMDVRV